MIKKKKIKMKRQQQRNKFLFQRIPAEVDKEEEGVIRKNIRLLSQRRLRNCSQM